MNSEMILFFFGIVWILFAAIEDIKHREIANWLNYSLIIFALGFRFFYSLFRFGDFSYFFQGLIGLGIFFILGSLFYYSKMFAGGDYSLLFALGAILPIYNDFSANLDFLFSFIFIFLLVGVAYGIIFSLVLGLKGFPKFKKRFKLQFKKDKVLVMVLTGLGVVFLIFSFFFKPLFYFAIFVVFMAYFYLFLKSVDESFMVLSVKPKNLTIGDLLYEDVRVGKTIIKAKWDGLNEKEIKMLQRKKRVLIHTGMPFGPVFLISFLLLFILLFSGVIHFPEFLLSFGI